MSDEFDPHEEFMDAPRSTRDTEFIIALAAAMRPPKNASKETILNTLIVTAIGALVGAVWTLSMNVARLEVKVDNIMNAPRIHAAQ